MSREQARYQVRFDWGAAGISALREGADVVVWVDALGEDPAPDAAPDLLSAVPASIPFVVEASLASARAVAHWVMELQQQLGRRIGLAVVGAGSTREDGSYRFAVEDLLAAGAVITELGALGLDATSPEAAAAASAYTGLQRATRHLLTASVSAQTSREAVTPAQARIDPHLTVADVVVLRPSAGAALLPA
jgi:hypothetical protein